LTYWDDWKEMVKHMDIVTLSCPLYPETEHMINKNTIQLFERGAYLVNTARGKLCARDVIVQALEDGKLAGYAGYVWFRQPPPAPRAESPRTHTALPNSQQTESQLIFHSRY
jgi:formate dehydrogenase